MVGDFIVSAEHQLPLGGRRGVDVFEHSELEEASGNIVQNPSKKRRLRQFSRLLGLRLLLLIVSLGDL